MHNFWKSFSKCAGLTQVACVAVIDGNKILMGKRRDSGKWTNPGGHMDPGEKPAEGAARELFEEAGIKVDPKDLEHVATKTVTKPDGKKITIHGFKLDQGKHKTTVAGDPDEEVYRWIWKSLPLPKDVAENLHVQKDNVLFDALGIDYPQEKTATAITGNPKPFFDALKDHYSKSSTVPGDHYDHLATPGEDPNSAPEEVKMASMHRRLMRMRIRRGDLHGSGDKIREQFAQHLLDRDLHHHRHHADEKGGDTV